MLIRQTAALANSDAVAIATFDGLTEVWRLVGRTQVAALDTIADWGGARLALVDAGNETLVVAASWKAGRVEARTFDASLVWARPDLRAVEGLHPLGARDYLAVQRVDSFEILDARTGKTVSPEGPWPYFLASSTDGAHLMVGDGSEVALTGRDGKVSWSAEMDGFAVSAAAMNSSRFIFCEVAEGSSAHLVLGQIGKGPERSWKSDSPGSVTRVAIDSALDVAVGVFRHFDDRPDLLIRWDPSADEPEQIALKTRTFDSTFAVDGTRLVLGGAGQVLDTRSGASIGDAPLGNGVVV